MDWPSPTDSVGQGSFGPGHTGLATELAWLEVVAGSGASCGVLTDGRLICWGREDCLPESTSGPQIAVEPRVSEFCSIRFDGALNCWCCWPGRDFCDRDIPEGAFTSVKLGDGWGCAQRTDGRLACFGAPRWQRTGDMPDERVLDYALDANYACAVLGDGRVQCWGDFVLWEDGGHAPPPGVAFRRISVGRQHACGLDDQGRVHCWGTDWEGDPWPAPPEGAFVDIETDHQVTCVVDASGLARCWWGWDRIDEWWFLPDERWRQIGLGEWAACGTTIDGRGLCWGPDGDGVVSGIPTLEELAE